MKIGVLLSGGVDSTVAAYLLKKQGHDLLAFTMVNHEVNPWQKAALAAEQLGIEHIRVDLADQFQTQVIDYFCSTYENGQTPNPCTVCNKTIKFGALMKQALTYGCEKIATGHYCRIGFYENAKHCLLMKGIDKSKDQSYFLYDLTQHQLQHIIFPLGELLKEDVKALAKELEFQAAGDNESQEICFIPNDYREFLKGKVNDRPGPICDEAGKILGEHRGLSGYTIGQRKGLGISWAHPLYVVALRTKDNTLVVGSEQELYHDSLLADQCNFIPFPELTSKIRVKAKIRYRTPEAEATLWPHENGQLQVVFDKPQRAITSGQAVVFYQDEILIGGGKIISYARNPHR